MAEGAKACELREMCDQLNPERCSLPPPNCNVDSPSVTIAPNAITGVA